MEAELLLKYSRPGPRYTSYPTAPVFHTDFTAETYEQLLAESNRPLSLYVHMPFCAHVCFFCACNVIYTANRKRARPYLDLIHKELDLLTHALGTPSPVKKLHLGGGTPTFLTPEDLDQLCNSLRSRFPFTPDCELSVELDPRETGDEHLEVLARHGFNRASLGAQDFDPIVQKAVNRIQPRAMTQGLLERLRASGYHGINLDLIYGLPSQTPLTFERTADAVVEMRPDRISLFQFAYLPDLKKHQLRIAADELPTPDTRARLFQLAADKFLAAGYRHIGMDHFALPEDELSRAEARGKLGRNFQGYVVQDNCDLLGVGLSSIGAVGNAYIQNEKNMDRYREKLEAGRLPVERGYLSNQDDLIRKQVINDLMCRFSLHPDRISAMFQIDFKSYFARELNALDEFVEDGLLTRENDRITITPRGRFVVRNISMVFDAHLEQLQNEGRRFSKTV